jgi:hypothetical protein
MVLIESNAERRKELATALRSTGNVVVAASRIAEVERWPIGEIVVAESSFFTPLWNDVGATHVVVLADSPALGRHAVATGASAWVPRHCEPGDLLALIRTLTDVRGASAAAFPLGRSVEPSPLQQAPALAAGQAL